LKERVLTAVIGIPIVMAACFYTQPWLFGIIVILCSIIGCQELARIGKARGAFLGTLLPVVALLALSGVLRLNAFPSTAAVMTVLLVLAMIGAVFAGKKGRLNNEIATFYVGAPLAAALILQQFRSGGGDAMFVARTYLLLALIPLWVGDSAAIFAGKAWGKHPLAPNISPKKTWEGAIANFIGCVIAGALVASFLKMPWVTGLVTGAVSGTLGQAGDLFESALKRKAGVKDSGAILPGHGGVLDRLDSLFATVIPIALIVSLWPK